MHKVRWFIGAFAVGILSGWIFRSSMIEPIPAIPNVRQVLAQVSALYAGCQSYRDEGSVSTEVDFSNGAHESWQESFSTAFARPDRFRFENSASKDRKYIIWRNGDDVLSWRDARLGAKRESSFDTALESASQATAGTSQLISSLLLPEFVAGQIFTNAESNWTIEDEERLGVPRYKIQGCLGDIRIAVSIDQETLLVEQIVFETQAERYLQTRTIVFNPVINEEISESYLSFGPSTQDSCARLADVLKSSPAQSVEADSDANRNIGEIQLRGSEEYRTCVRGGLEILSSRDPESCAMVLKYINSIEENSPHGFWPFERNSSLGLRRESACYSPAFCAAMLVYYAQQSKLYYDYEDQVGLPVPTAAWMGSDAITFCSERAMQSLKSIGGPEYQIAYLMQNDISLATPKWEPATRDVRD